ncbi:MAG: MerR family transcriptional regulator [Candidatus Nanopelagicales bacterium]
MYTIKRAAELTGISVPTLRAWERRYSVVHPERTESGYRMYDASALAALTTMNQLVHDGWTPSQAAAETLRRAAADGAATLGGADRLEEAGKARPPTAKPVRPEPGSPAGGVGPGVDTLARAAAALDPTAVSELLDEAFGVASFEQVADRWLMPALTALGDAWSHGRVSVAGEHMVSHAVQRRLAAAYEAAAHLIEGRSVIVGLPPGARHEVGLLAFAVAARRAGLPTVYLGADVPAGEWPAVVSGHGARCVVLAVPTQSDVKAARAVVAELRAAHPGLVIAVGGRMQDRAPAGCIRLGHSIGAAARDLSRLLAESTTG